MWRIYQKVLRDFLRMFIEDLSEVVELARRAGTTVFAVGNEIKVTTTKARRKRVVKAKEIVLPGAIVIEPKEGRGYIAVEQVREVIEMVRAKQTSEQFLVFNGADKLREEAENAILKLLEEPKENYHFVLLVENVDALLPTILSRAEVYYLRKKDIINESPDVDKKILEMAKRLLVVRDGLGYLRIADEIHKKKDERDWALGVLATTIELAYKSYFLTGKQQFLRKIPKLIKAHKNITSNGNVRLHLVADLC